MMFSPQTTAIGVSSWALHRLVGGSPNFGADAGNTIPEAASERAKAADLPLHRLPGELARHGFDALQLCHFHLGSRDPAYLSDLHAAIRDAGLPLRAFLVDEGDITHGEFGEFHARWISDWLPVAAALGAQEVRVIAGKSVSDHALARSAATLRSLAHRARAEGVALITENWFPLLSSPAAVHELLDRCEGEVGFLLDFSNWGGAAKYANLAQIAPLAASCHAQASFVSATEVAMDDLGACLSLPYPPGFTGPFFLVNSGPAENPWEGVGLLRDMIRTHFAARQMEAAQ